MISSNKLRQFSRLGQRGAYGQSLLLLAQQYANIFCLSADLGNSSGLDRFSLKYPDRYLNLGIAEQHMIGFAAGLASTGFNCFVSSFAPFITMRCCEQIRLNLSYMRENVKLVSIGSGLSMGYLGNSHFGLEDISIIQSQVDLPIYCPSDTTQLFSILHYLSQTPGPAYLRLTGTASTSHLIYNSLQDIIAGGTTTLANGDLVLLLSHGSITSDCLEAVRMVSETCSNKVHHEDVYCLYPLGERLIQLVSSFNKILVVEEHRETGGLFSKISTLLSNMTHNTRLSRLTLPDTFLVSGDYAELKSYYRLEPAGIRDALVSLLQ